MNVRKHPQQSQTDCAAQGKDARRAASKNAASRGDVMLPAAGTAKATEEEEDLPLAARRSGRHQPKKTWDSPECPAARAYTNKRAGKRVMAPRPAVA